MKLEKVRAIKRHLYGNKMREVGEVYHVPPLHAQILSVGRYIVIVATQETSIPVEKPEVYPEFPIKKRRGRPLKDQTYSRRDLRAEP